MPAVFESVLEPLDTCPPFHAWFHRPADGHDPTGTASAPAQFRGLTAGSDRSASKSAGDGGSGFQHFYMGRLKNDRGAALSSLVAAVEQGRPVWCVSYINMAGRYTAVRQDFHLLWANPNDGSTQALGAYQPAQAFEHVWVPNLELQLARAATAAPTGTAPKVTASASLHVSTAPSLVPYSREAALLWMDAHHLSLHLPMSHPSADLSLLPGSVVGFDATWQLKRSCAAAHAAGDWWTAFQRLTRLQLLHGDTASVPLLKRLHASVVGAIGRALIDGGHLVALLRGAALSKELKLRLKMEVVRTHQQMAGCARFVHCVGACLHVWLSPHSSWLNF